MNGFLGAGPVWLQDAGLLYLRLTGSLLLLYVHGWPKVMHFSSELQHIEDPMHLGRGFSLGFAIFAEVFCPILIAAGLLVRAAALPIVCLLGVAMFLVHPDWSIADGQFGWLLLIVFGALALAGGGRFSIDQGLSRRA
ncbi:MAG TPA: DoxX family protein [Burkholderiaceae bacterium]|nr:DoxX family protein [Burkholderiaceae bacterium]